MINWKNQLTLLQKIANFPSNQPNVSGRRLWDKLRLSGGHNRPPVAEAKCRMACGAFFNTLDQAQKLRIKFSKKAVLRLRRPLHWEIYGIRNKHPLVCMWMNVALLVIFMVSKLTFPIIMNGMLRGIYFLLRKKKWND